MYLCLCLHLSIPISTSSHYVFPLPHSALSLLILTERKMLPRAIVSSTETDIVLRASQMSLLLTQVLAALASQFILLCSALAQSAKDRHLIVWVCLAEP